MAHVPGHIDPRVDQALQQLGTQGGTLPERRNPRPTPSLFDATASNLFGDIALSAGGRQGDILGLLFGPLLPPSKKQKAAFAQLKVERAEKLKRARTGAVQEFAAASGLSTPAAKSAALASPELAQSLEATARGERGGRESLNALANRAIRQQLPQQQTRAARADLPLEIQQQVDEIERQHSAQLITNRSQFVDQVETNPALTKSTGSLVAASQLLDTINDPGFTALDLTTDAVLFTQVIEPGLAVREDDRMAFNRAATSGFEFLKNTANQFASGEIDGEQARKNVQASLFSIMRTPAQRTKQAIAFWQSVGKDIPGVKEGDVLGATAITPRMIEMLDRFALNPFEGTE